MASTSSYFEIFLRSSTFEIAYIGRPKSFLGFIPKSSDMIEIPFPSYIAEYTLPDFNVPKSKLRLVFPFTI